MDYVIKCASPMSRSIIYIETSHTAVSNSRTGIQTVVRGLISGLALQGIVVHPVRWSFRKRCLTPLRSQWEKNLGRSGRDGPWLPISSLWQRKHWWAWKKSRGLNHRAAVHLHPRHREVFCDGDLLLPELMEGQHIRLVTDYARRQGMRVTGIFHDAIAWRHPEMVRHWTREQHADYMEALAGLDGLVAVSEEAARDFIAFAKSRHLRLPPVYVCPLAAEIEGQARENLPMRPSDGTVRILCVSTLEPRKNHAAILAAFATARRRCPQIKLELHLVGAEYVAAPEIACEIRAVTQRNSAVFWHESVGSEELREWYRACDFSVFGSWIEGFGLPVVESLWFGKPCLCSREGVMAENARDGGCLTVDTRDVAALADGMIQLASRPDLRERLGEQARKRELKSWQTYAGEISGILSMNAGADQSRSGVG